MGIARELSRENITQANVQIAADLPITWVSNQREDFRQYLIKTKMWFFHTIRRHTLSISRAVQFTRRDMLLLLTGLEK